MRSLKVSCAKMCGMIVAVMVLFAEFAATQSDSSVNQIYRPLNEAVPACKAFGISWQPSTNSTVSLTLLRGPLGNSVPIATLAVHIPNSGVYFWTPESNLEGDASLYLIQLTDDATGEYQTSAQFGVSKGPECTSMSAQITSAAQTQFSTGFLTFVSVTSSSPPLPVIQATGLPTSHTFVGSESIKALSTGAKAGIGVAVPAFVFSLIAACFLLWRRQRTRHAAPADGAATVRDSDAPLPTFYGFMSKSELDSTRLTELSAEEPEKPLLDSTPIAELPPHGLEVSEQDSRTSVPRSVLDNEKCGLESVTMIELPSCDANIAAMDSPAIPASHSQNHRYPESSGQTTALSLSQEFLTAELESTPVVAHFPSRAELDSNILAELSATPAPESTTRRK